MVTSLATSGFTFGIGALSDYIAALNFYVVSPNSSLPVAFNAGSTQGTAAYAINPGALPGAVDSGLFTITYDLLINDPNIGGSDPGDQFGFSFADVAASVTVTDAPEPAALSTTFAAGAILVAVSRLRRKR